MFSTVVFQIIDVEGSNQQHIRSVVQREEKSVHLGKRYYLIFYTVRPWRRYCSITSHQESDELSSHETLRVCSRKNRTWTGSRIKQAINWMKNCSSITRVKEATWIAKISWTGRVFGSSTAANNPRQNKCLLRTIKSNLLVHSASYEVL